MGSFPSEESTSNAYWGNGERAGISILVSVVLVMLLSQHIGTINLEKHTKKL